MRPGWRRSTCPREMVEAMGGELKVIAVINGKELRLG
ncbi:MAG: hypothetical protein RLZZ450_2660 [Pseudomonadota bacterium]|jgi:hypothetical protein